MFMTFRCYAIMGISLSLQTDADEDEFLVPSQIFCCLYEIGPKVWGYLKVSKASLLNLKEKRNKSRGFGSVFNVTMPWLECLHFLTLVQLFFPSISQI